MFTKTEKLIYVQLMESVGILLASPHSIQHFLALKKQLFYTDHILVEQTVNMNCWSAFVDSQLQVGSCQTTNNGAEVGEADCDTALLQKIPWANTRVHDVDK